MDAFYASVEQHDDPRLAGLPVIVGGTGPRGVVAAASYEVRKFGVRSAMPMRQALERCPQAVCVRPRMARYQEVSRQVFAIFNEFTPVVQGLSLDEAFLDVTASREPVAQIARAIKQRIREVTGLTASVGAAGNKLVAKIASDLHKPDGLTVVTPQNLRAVLDPLPVRRLPGLGGKTGLRLEEAGVRTLGELRVAGDDRAVRRFSAGIVSSCATAPPVSMTGRSSLNARNCRSAPRIPSTRISMNGAGCARRWRNWRTSPAVEPVTANWRPVASASRSANMISRP